MARRALLVVIVGACGSSSAPVRGPAAAAAGGACPAADQVVVLRWMTETDDGNAVAPGWRAFVSNRALDQNDGPSYQTLAAAPPGGVALPSAVTIYQEGVAPCRATAAKPFRMVTNVGPVSEQLGVELTGCAAPAADAPQEAFGLVGRGEPGACAFTAVADVAMRAADADDHWQVKPGETPLPAELAAALGASPHACAAPACEALWYARGAGTFAYDVVQTWIKPGTGDACAFEHDDATTILVRGASGLAALPAADVGNLSLVGVFHDAGGARLAVLEDVGEFTVITLGVAAAPVHRVWFDKNEEDSNWRSLAPYCGP